MNSEIAISSWIVEIIVCGWIALRIRMVSWPATGFTRYVFNITLLLALGLSTSLVPFLFSLEGMTAVWFAVIGDFLLLSGVAAAWMLVWFLYLKPKNISRYFVLVPVVLYLAALQAADFVILSNHYPYREGNKYFMYFHDVWHIFFALFFAGLVIIGVHFIKMVFENKGVPRLRAATWGILFFGAGSAVMLGPIIDIKNRDLVVIFSGILFIFLTAIFLVLHRVAKKK